MDDTKARDTSELAALVERYRAGFADLDTGRLTDLWDRDHDGLVYVAQEIAEPMRGWDAIHAYYVGLPTVHPGNRVLEMRVSDVSIDVLGDVATVFCRFDFAAAVAGREQPFLATGRVTFVCRRTDHGWAVIQYHESARPETDRSAE